MRLRVRQLALVVGLALALPALAQDTPPPVAAPAAPLEVRARARAAIPHVQELVCMSIRATTADGTTELARRTEETLKRCVGPDVRAAFPEGPAAEAGSQLRATWKTLTDALVIPAGETFEQRPMRLFTIQEAGDELLGRLQVLADEALKAATAQGLTAPDEGTPTLDAGLWNVRRNALWVLSGISEDDKLVTHALKYLAQVDGELKAATEARAAKGDPAANAPYANLHTALEALKKAVEKALEKHEKRPETIPAVEEAWKAAFDARTAFAAVPKATR